MARKSWIECIALARVARTINHKALLAFLLTCAASGSAFAQNVSNQASIQPPAGVNNSGTTCPAANFNSGTGTCTATDTDALLIPVTITKTVTVSDGQTTVSPAGNYQFTLTCTAPSAATYNGTITFAAGETSKSTVVNVAYNSNGCTLSETAKPTAPTNYAWGTVTYANPAGPITSAKTGTITNPLVRQSAQLILQKTWSPNSIAGDQTTVSTSSFTNNASSGPSTATAAGNTTSGAPVTVYVGESGQITETSFGNLGNYTQSWSCTGGGTLTGGNTLQIVAADAGKTITCTETNTIKSVQLSVAKTWAAGANAGDTATVSVPASLGSATSGPSTATSAGNTTQGAAVTVSAGATGQLSETGTNLGNYTASYACTGGATVDAAGNVTITASSATATCTVTNTIIPKPKLALDKTGPTTATVGIPYDYVVTVKNTGTAATTAASTVTDTIDAGLTINGTPAGCTVAAQLVTCTVSAGLAANATQSFTINVTPNGSVANATVHNVAYVKGGGDAACATACNSPDVPTLVNAAKLTLAKTGPATATVGFAYDYVITVKNTGTAATTAISTITDTIDAGLTINSAAGCTIAAPLVSCDVPAGLAINATQSFTINVTPTGSVANATVHNVAYVKGGGDPACATACNSPDVPTQVNAPKLTINKTGPASAVVGQSYSYVITVTNNGAVATTTVSTVTDTVDAGLTINSATGCTIAAPTVTCSVPAGLAVGAQQQFTIIVTPAASIAGVTVNNTAHVQGGGDPACATACDSQNVPTLINTPSNITLAKSGPAAVLTNGAVAYKIDLGNSGQTASGTTVTVKDQLPAGMTYVGVTPGAGVSTVTCTGAPALTCTVTLSAPLAAGAANGAATFTINTTAPATSG
ncbi:MAG: hypothetical protein JSR70_02735, partial [Proteobacteria bacterium]|nr:hypothetical protein [Pseudomonadota bacterium]